MRALVAGGAGFLGSHLVDLLLARGHRVVVVDSFLTSTPRNLRHHAGHPRLRVIRCDVRDTPFGRYDRLYHLASPASPEDYGALPIETLLTNALGTARLLEVALRARARFLLASTSEVYGDPLVHPQPETYFGNVDPVGPRSAYDEGKRFAEAIATAYMRAKGLDVRITRIFNAYGPRMRPDDGRMPSAFITSALRSEPLPVQGTGRHTRSLCYVVDVAEGLIAAQEKGRRGEVYNVGRPDEMRVIDFARLVLRATGSRAAIAHVPGRPQDIRQRRPDISKARRDLGWRPRTSLLKGLRLTVDWYRAELDMP
ncbi:MAG: GDP-mannose 4,6-dehydratase [Elusimicrobia bacterium]|nr:GDP-mannose 4,6-dehydratase [Elusimicrobiota bacterium]